MKYYSNANEWLLSKFCKVLVLFIIHVDSISGSIYSQIYSTAAAAYRNNNRNKRETEEITNTNSITNSCY